MFSIRSVQIGYKRSSGLLTWQFSHERECRVQLSSAREAERDGVLVQLE
jgi:hypothetical protein